MRTPALGRNPISEEVPQDVFKEVLAYGDKSWDQKLFRSWAQFVDISGNQMRIAHTQKQAGESKHKGGFLSVITWLKCKIPNPFL